MIRVNCPACAKRLKVPVEGAGRTIKCPRCATGVVVPAAPPDSPDGDDLDLDKEPVLGPLFDEEPAPPPSRPVPRPLPPPVRPPLPPVRPPLPPPVIEPLPAVVTPPLVPAAVWDADPVDEDDPPVSPQPGDAVQGVRYVTEDPSWFGKMALGGLIISFPILEAVCDGYQIQTIRNLRAGKRQPLPAWDDLGGLFMSGLPLRLVIYAMYLPAIALSVLTLFVDVAWIARFFFDSDTRQDMRIGRILFDLVLTPLLNLFVAVLQAVLFLTVPALARRVADGETFASLFDPRPTLRLIASNLTPYIMARLTVFVLLVVFGIVTGVLSGVGWVVVIGPVIGWLVLGVGRFWGRLTWAYHLAHMKTPVQ